MKLDFTRADDIIQVTETCPVCLGSGSVALKLSSGASADICERCGGQGKIIEFMTPKGLRSLLQEKSDDKVLL